LHVQAQACANEQGAVFIQSAFEGGPQPDRRPSPNASEFEAGAGAGTTAPSERRHNCYRHAFHRLAAAPDRVDGFRYMTVAVKFDSTTPL
jgi:hypothetical protein